MTAAYLESSLHMILPVAILIVGVLVKYLPQMKKVANDTIPYLGVVISFLTQLFAPAVAHAAFGGVAAKAGLSITDMLFTSCVHSVMARQLYEGFGRSFLEKILGLQKPRV